METQDIVHQIYLKFLHISLTPFTPYKLLPGFQKIFNGYDIIVRTKRTMNPPPENSLGFGKD